MAAPKGDQVDWEGVEKQYRLGQKSMRVIAEEFGVNASNISRRAKKEEWVQDKSEEVRQRTNATLIAQRECNTPTREDIDVAVKTNIAIITRHRKDAQQQQDIVRRLMTILEERVNAQQLTFDELRGSANVMRDCSQAFTKLVQSEREAYNLGSNTPQQANINVSGDMNVIALIAAIKRDQER